MSFVKWMQRKIKQKNDDRPHLSGAKARQRRSQSCDSTSAVDEWQKQNGGKTKAKAASKPMAVPEIRLWPEESPRRGRRVDDEDEEEDDDDRIGCVRKTKSRSLPAETIRFPWSRVFPTSSGSHKCSSSNSTISNSPCDVEDAPRVHHDALATPDHLSLGHLLLLNPYAINPAFGGRRHSDVVQVLVQVLNT